MKINLQKHLGEKSGRFTELLMKLKNSNHHGAVIVFSRCCEDEVNRFEKCKRGIRFENVISFLDNKNDNIFPNLSSIDGAVLMDYNLNCYGVGYILDGIAVVSGDKARGARYNSINSYLWNLKVKCGKNCKHFAVVLSEDGDVTPNYGRIEANKIFDGEATDPIGNIEWYLSIASLYKK